MILIVTVIPPKPLLEKKNGKDSQNRHHPRFFGIKRLERLGQKFQKCRSNQAPCGEAHKKKRNLPSEILSPQEDRSAYKRAYAAHDARQKYFQKHKVFLLYTFFLKKRRGKENHHTPTFSSL